MWTLLILFALCPAAFASYGPCEADLIAIGSGIEYPRETEYLDDYYYGVVQAPGGHSVYCYGSADMLGSKYTVADGEEVEILARRGQMLCVIIPSQNKARWIREENVKTSVDFDAPIGIIGQYVPNFPSPSDADLKAIQSQIEYPKSNEYWNDYGYGIVTDRRSDSVTCYGSADRLGSKYTISVGEFVVVLANRDDMYCVLIPTREKARWINKANVDLYREYNSSDPFGYSARSEGQTVSTETGEIPAAVLDARSGVVHVYRLYYDEQGNLIAYSSGAGIVTVGATLPSDIFPKEWNCVLTSLSCVASPQTPPDYATYQIIVIADGKVYKVRDVGVSSDMNQELALLFLEDTIPNRHSIAFTKTELLKEGDPVYVVGFPDPLTQNVPGFESFQDEEMIVPGKILEPALVDSGASYVQANIGTQMNLVGGALVTSDGHLAGLVSVNGGSRDTLAIPCDDIADYLVSLGMPTASAVETSPPT